jgi:SNF2 family DNA or RNA helicase
MKWTPKPYQIRGASLMVSRQGSGQLLDPGMGKTSTALAAFDVLREEHNAKMLVIAPIKPMYGTWPVEPQKWDDFNHLKVQVIHGPKKKQALLEDADIYVINPEAVVWYFDQKNRPECEILCVDESTYFKNSQSKRFKKLRKYLGEFNWRWILTGTITPNGLLDLFSQAFIMDRGESLGEYITHYKGKWFYQEGFGGYTWTPFPGAMEEIATLVAPMVLKLNAEDHLDMPDLMVIPRYVDLPEEAMKIYKEVEKEFLVNLTSGTIVAANVAAAGTKCRQIANGAVYDENKVVHPIHMAKMEALEELVHELNGHPLLIFYEYEHDKDRIMGYLGKEAKCITGVTGKKFTKIQDDFNAGRIPFLVAHPGSVHGLNIQGACHHMIWYCITWNLEHYIQAVWRLYRQGQQAKIVKCYHIISKGTKDVKVAEVLDYKEADMNKLELALMEGQ